MSEHRTEMRNIMRAYAALQLAAAFQIANENEGPLSWQLAVALILLAISIPATIAYAGLARITPEDEARNPNPISFVSGILTFLPSILAISFIILKVSLVASVIFFLSCFGWAITVIRLRNSQARSNS
jgi:hypothetical protein